MFSRLIAYLLRLFGGSEQRNADQAQVIKDVEARNAIEMDVAREPDPVGELQRKWSRDGKQP